MTLEVVGTIVGLVYLWLEYRASIYVWVTGIIMPAIYMVVYYRAGLYADCAINVYYIVAALYGVVMWLTSYVHAEASAATTASRVPDDRVGGDIPVIVHTPRSMWPWLLAACLLLWAAIAFVLVRYTDSTVPVADAFTTSLSIVAMYMLAHKHAEQWIVWIIVDAVCVILYIYKNLDFTAALYALYTVVAVAGYMRWTRLASPSQARLA